MRRVLVPALLLAALGGCCHCPQQPPEKPAATDDRHHEPAPPIANGTQGEVEKVYDGDTFKVRLPDGQHAVLRILGIDCPEAHRNSKCERDGRQGRLDCDAQLPLGRAAGQHAEQLLAHQTVTIETRDGTGTTQNDPYGRALAYVKLADGRDFGLVMIREAQCHDFGWKYPHPRMDAYKAADTHAP
jgi:endonuclease YncB( thermonuclease family)